MLKSFFLLVVKLISPLLFFLGIIFLSFLYYHTKHYIKGSRIKKSISKYKKPSIIRRIFLQFPERLSKDIYNREPGEFKEYGLHMFCGEQGSGKTTSVVHLLQLMKEKYPKCLIRTNMNYLHEDGKLTHWKDLVSNSNGIYGQIEVIDEIQTWFNSLQSKDFPVEMLTEISQQRKQRKMLVGTAQVYSRIAKPIREQTTFVYMPFTILGCFTIVRVTKPQYWDDKNQKFTKYLKNYFFIHTDSIRNSFDTYMKIQKYSEDGFKSEAEHMERSNYNNNIFLINGKKSVKKY